MSWCEVSLWVSSSMCRDVHAHALDTARIALSIQYTRTCSDIYSHMYCRYVSIAYQSSIPHTHARKQEIDLLCGAPGISGILA